MAAFANAAAQQVALLNSAVLVPPRPVQGAYPWPLGRQPPVADHDGQVYTSCTACKQGRRSERCDADPTTPPGIGCTDCKKRGLQCRWGQVGLAPRPDGLTIPLCCDQCLPGGMTTCSWRAPNHSSATGSCRTCARSRILCTFMGHPTQNGYAAAIGQKHYNMTQNMAAPDQRPPHQREANANPILQFVPGPPLPRDDTDYLRCELCASRCAQRDVRTRSARCDVNPHNPAGPRGCKTCQRYGTVCVVDGYALPPHQGRRRADPVKFDKCINCNATGRNCDRTRPCYSCVGNNEAHLCGGRAHGCFWKGVPGDDMPTYFMATGYGPNGVDDPPAWDQVRTFDIPIDHHLHRYPALGTTRGTGPNGPSRGTSHTTGPGTGPSTTYGTGPSPSHGTSPSITYGTGSSTSYSTGPVPGPGTGPSITYGTGFSTAGRPGFNRSAFTRPGFSTGRGSGYVTISRASGRGATYGTGFSITRRPGFSSSYVIVSRARCSITYTITHAPTPAPIVLGPSPPMQLPMALLPDGPAVPVSAQSVEPALIDPNLLHTASAPAAAPVTSPAAASTMSPSPAPTGVASPVSVASDGSWAAAMGLFVNFDSSPAGPLFAGTPSPLKQSASPGAPAAPSPAPPVAPSPYMAAAGAAVSPAYAPPSPSPYAYPAASPSLPLVVGPAAGGGSPVPWGPGSPGYSDHLSGSGSPYSSGSSGAGARGSQSPLSSELGEPTDAEALFHSGLTEEALKEMQIYDNDEELNNLGGYTLFVEEYNEVWKGALYLVRQHDMVIDLRSIRLRLRQHMLQMIPSESSRIRADISDYLQKRFSNNFEVIEPAVVVSLPAGANRDIVARLNPGHGPLRNVTAQPVIRPPSPGPPRPLFHLDDLNIPPPNQDGFPAGHPAHVDLSRVVRPLPPHPNPDPSPAMATVPFQRIYGDGRRLEEEVLSCSAETAQAGVICSKPTAHICEDTEHPDQNFPLCTECDGQNREAFSEEFRSMVPLLRAYACSTCNLELTLAPKYRGSGVRVWGFDITQDFPIGGVSAPVPRAGWTNYGGFKGEPLAQTGCSCALKLFGRRLCSPHRLRHTIVLRNMVTELRDWVVSAYGRMVCPFCRIRPGVDAFNFQGEQGGEGQVRVWACLGCHGVVVGGRDAIPTLPDEHNPQMVPFQNALGPRGGAYVANAGPAGAAPGGSPAP
ncbi:hypothetical protein AAE478_001924 [Parahypoxylon ruwenzoriense]